jgi:hypothetical protein
MRIERVWFDNDNIYVVTDSAHTIGNPLIWFKRLSNATAEERNNYELGPFGESIHWPAIDEDLSLEGFSILNSSCTTRKYKIAKNQDY